MRGECLRTPAGRAYCRRVNTRAEIEALVGFDRRWSGTDAERRAAEHLTKRLEKLGRAAEIEPTSVFPGYALTHALHALLAIAGSVLSVYSAVAGAILVLLAAVSTFGDLTGGFFLLRRLTGRRASQNVVSAEDGDKPGTLILVAHYDAARGGAFFGRRMLERRAVIDRLLRRPIGPFEPIFWSMLVILMCTVLRLAGIEGTALTIVQFIPTVVLIVALPLLVDIALSDVVPGANDNASGVATALRLADRFGGELENFDLWVLLTGSEEPLLLGMREWMRRHRRELDARSTAFVCLDRVGAGTVRFTRKEGYLVAHRYHPALLELCGEIADEDAGDADRYAARGLVSRTATDAYVARSAGFPAVTVSSANALDYSPHYHQPSDTPDHVEDEALERAFGFSSELIERIDDTIGPQLERSGDSALVED